jgi:pimeloyl-ACP methyl ester carboxylesterase
VDKDGQNPSNWPTVITIHGIRTTGRWQKELSDVLTQARYRHVPLDFGFFLAFSLLMPWSRSKKVEWFHSLYSEKFGGLERRPSIIAHSFGSYIVTKAMLKYDYIRFERIILCGSIVSRSYPWKAVIHRRHQVDAVLNEAGGRDAWAGLVEWVVADAGSSGVSGFEDLADGAVTQIVHAEHRHSDFFHALNYRERWLPFLSGVQLNPVISIPSKGLNWRFVSTLLLLSAVAAGLSWNFWPKKKSEPVDTDKIGITQKPPAAINSPAAITKIEPTESLPQLPKTEKSAGSATVNAPNKFEGSLQYSDNEEVSTPRAMNTRTLFEYLNGDWIHESSSGEFVFEVKSGKCHREMTVLSKLHFQSSDNSMATVLAGWEETTVQKNRYEKIDEEGFEEGRIHCLGLNLEGFSGTWTMVALGQVTARAGDPLDLKSIAASLNVADCTNNSQQCPPSFFGVQPQQMTIEKISESTFRCNRGSQVLIYRKQ